jgi:hypothetical protein
MPMIDRAVIALLPLLVSPEWVEERKLSWSITSPIYQSKVLGDFPDIPGDSLILPERIETADKRKLGRTWRPKESCRREHLET